LSSPLMVSVLFRIIVLLSQRVAVVGRSCVVVCRALRGQRLAGMGSPVLCVLSGPLSRIRLMFRILCTALVGLMFTGCTGPSERSVASGLYLRIKAGDCSAYVELNDLAHKGLKYANTYLGLSLQTTEASKCLQPTLLALHAYNRAFKEVPEAAFNAALLELSARRAARAEELLSIASGKDKKSGLPMAMVRLALLYEAGAPGVLRNDSLAAQHFERAAATGDLYARFRFAQILMAGKGRSADPDQGLDLLESCAFKGLPAAMLELHEIRKNQAGKREEAGRWLGMYATYRPAAQPKYNAFLATMPPREQKAVRDAVSRYSVSKVAEWSVPDYLSPIAP
jgi:hypothetical protein